MKIRIWIPAMILVICAGFFMSVTVCAHDVPDMSREGSVSVRMMYGGKAVPGGTLTLYRVGEIREDDGNYSFILSDAYKECGVSLEDLESASLPPRLAEYTSAHGINGTEVQIGSDGKATAGNLKLGLYLVVQTKAAANYEAAAPFLVSVPMYEDGSYIYNVDATPKMSTLTEKAPDPEKPATPANPRLPQTGQLNWPVPVLAALGLFLILLGYVMRYGKRGISYEA